MGCGYRLGEIALRKKLSFFTFGIDKKGYREILDFEVNPSEGAESWLEMMELQKLGERIKEYFPKADFQSCVVHKVRNTLNKVKAKDRGKVAKDLRRIYQVSR